MSDKTKKEAQFKKFNISDLTLTLEEYSKRYIEPACKIKVPIESVNYKHLLGDITDNLRLDRIKLENEIIRIDNSGELCYLFAKVIGGNIGKLQDAVIEKDWSGYICFMFSRDVPEADTEKLSEVIKNKNSVEEVYNRKIRYDADAALRNYIAKK